MLPAKQVELPSKILDDLTEIERQMQLWHTEALLLASSVEAIGLALRMDASQIQFRGDLIMFEGRSSDPALVIVNLARIRNVVCNLKALQAQRKEVQAQEKQIRRAG
jgi:hypothetical protein